MKFKYKNYAGRFMPIVPMKIKGNDWNTYNAYVDSGASRSIFHSDVADDLEINLGDGDKVNITVGDGSQIIVYIHKLTVRIAGQEFKASIGFSRNLGIGFNIIGRLDIFSKFKICFDDKEKILEFYTKK